MSKTAKLPPLEASLTEIATLVEQMEQQELTLEQSLQHFERGVTLVRHCQQLLATAEQKVELLLQQNNQDTLIPFTATDSTNDE